MKSQEQRNVSEIVSQDHLHEFLTKDLQRAREIQQSNRQVHADEQKEINQSEQRLYWQLFLAAAGAISLSITFVAFYYSIDSSPPLHLRLLGITWALFIISMICDVTRNLLESKRRIYETHSNWLQATIDLINKERKFFEYAPGQKIDAETLEKLDEFPEKKIKYLNALKRRKNRSRKLGRVADYLVIIAGDIAIFGFIAGMCCLTTFAYWSLTLLNK